MLLLLAVEPILAHQLDSVIGISSSTTPVMSLLAAMPATPLVVAFAIRYGGDEKLASTLVIGSCVLSAVTLPLMAYYLL